MTYLKKNSSLSSDKPRVSICIPARNSAQTIGRTLQSAIAQTFDDCEIIVVDNASTDSTAAEVARFTDGRIRYYKNPCNIEAVPNWNRCLVLAKGEYIKYLFSDDVLAKDCLEKEVSFLDSHPTAVLVTSACRVVDVRDRVLLTLRNFPSTGCIDGKTVARRSLQRQNLIGAPSLVMFRRSIAERVGGFDDKLEYTTDFDFFVRIAYEGDVGYIDETLVDFRVMRSSGTYEQVTQRNYNILADHWLLLQKHAKLGQVKLTRLDRIVSLTWRTIRNIELLGFILWRVRE